MAIIIEIVKELNIEVSSPNVFQAVVAKQYDMNTRFIKATFVDNGDKIYIDPNATVKVVINALRPDGEAKGFDGEVNQDGTVTVPLHSWMLEQVGTVTCDISVIDTETDDNKKLTTTSFTLYVERAAWGGDGITSDPQYDLLIELLNSCDEAGAKADEALQKSSEAIERAESVQGIYVGSGEMPDGYSIQIDPNGAVYEMDTELNPTSQNPLTNSAITQNFEAANNRMTSMEGNIASTMSGIFSLSNDVRALQTTEAERNKVLWEGSATVSGDTSPTVAVAAIGIHNYSVINIDGRTYTRDTASNSFCSITFERALYGGEHETIALDIRTVWYGQDLAAIRMDAEVGGRDRVCSHTRLFLLLDVDITESGATMFEYPTSFSISKIVGVM